MENKSPLAVPIAIVIAGVIIAGAVYFSNKGNQATVAQNPGTPQSTDIRTTDLMIKPISQQDYIRGNPNAKVVVVEYSDPECPFCKKFQTTMQTLANKYVANGSMAWVYRNFPLKDLHSRAPKESEALLCAGKLGGNAKFWQYTDRVYEVTTSNDTLDPAKLPQIAKEVGLDVTTFNTCLSSGEMTGLVAASVEDATNSGGSGTPYSVFVANKAFDKKEVQDFLIKNVLQYGFPTDLFAISNDNMRVSVSGAMPQQFMEDLIGILSK